MDDLKNNPQNDVAAPTHDFSPKDLERIEKFKEEGMPGLLTLDETKVARILDLYLSGKTYHQISRIMRVEKALVLYLSKKFNWFSTRQEYLFELESNIRSRVVEAKLTSQDFLLELTSVWQKKIGSKITKYLASGEDSHAEEIDLKEVDKYLKTIEMLHKLTSEGSPKSSGGQSPAIGLNLGDGVTITKKSDNEVEITPKQAAIGDVLKKFADLRREEEKKKNSAKSDIKGKQGDKNEN